MFNSLRTALASLAAIVATAAILWMGVGHAEHVPQTPPARPPIVGISHIGLRTADLSAARKFYTGVLGLAECFSLDDPPGKLLLTYFKVNDHQYIEIFPGEKSAAQGWLSHIAFETANAEQL